MATPPELKFISAFRLYYNDVDTMSTNKKSVNVERRTWDVTAYEEKAVARQQQQQLAENSSDHVNDGNPTFHADTKEEFIPAPAGAIGPEGSQRAYLQARKRKAADFIDARVGSSSMISIDDAMGTKKSLDSHHAIAPVGTDAIKITDGVTKSSSGGGVGFHCKVCDCYLKDSLTYLDHVNGRKHQRKLGYTMRVERSTESDLLTKLNELKKAKQETSVNDSNIIDYDKIVQEKDIDEERQREERKRLRKERRKRHTNTETDVPHVKEGETAKDVKADHHHPEPVLDDAHHENDDDEEEEEEPEALIDPAMAAMMGFTGFGGGT